MSPLRTWRVLRKDLSLGPRSPLFLYAIMLPVAMTFILQVAFGSLFSPSPRLGVVDFGASQITEEVQRIEGIEVTLLDDVAELKRQVEANDLDAGLVLVADFDRKLRAGERPPLELYNGGESLASNRIVLDVTAIDLLRAVEGSPSPVNVQLQVLGDADPLDISRRLVPVIVFYALTMAGIFVPASSLVEEKEKGTLNALLVTPTRASEVVLAKAGLGFLLTFTMAFVALALNDALGSTPLALVLVIALASWFAVELGLIVGTISKDSTTLFALIKGAGIFLFAPVIFYLFPSWPQWIAKLFPTYWIIDPIFQVAVVGESLGSVSGTMWVAVLLGVLMIPLIGFLSRRMLDSLAAA